MKHLNLVIIALLLSLSQALAQAPITGPTEVCVGSSIALSDVTPGGSWTISPTAYATVSTGGVVTGLALGTADVTYTVGASYVTYPITVDVAPAPITGPSTLCAGTFALESAAPTGGTWSSSAVTVAAIDPVTGIVSGYSAGATTITYTIGTGCSATKTIYVSRSPAPITGASAVCVGTTGAIADATPGGAWSISAPSIASIGLSGGVTGLSAGVATITYVVGTGCAATMVITVTATPSAYTVTGGGNYCAGGTGVHIGLAGSTIGVSYELLVSGITTGITITGTGSAIDFGLQTAAGIYTVVANPGTSCATSMMGSAVVTVSTLPAAFTITGGGTYCAGGTGSHIGLSGSQTGVNYQLFNGATPVSAAVAGSGGLLDFGAVTAPGVYTVIATNTTTTCSNNMLGPVTVSVSSLPTVFTIIGGGSYCAGGPGTDISLSSSNVGVNYTLAMGGSTVATLSGTGSTLDFGLVIPAGSYTITAIDAATGCSTAYSAVTVAINPLPTAFTVTGGGSYCSGGAGVAIGLPSSTAGVSYQLYGSGIAIGSPLSGTGTALSFGLVTAAGSYTVVATNMATGCFTNMSGTAVVTVGSPVTPTITMAATPGTGVCAGTTVTYTSTITNGGTTPTYTWFVNGAAAASGGVTYTYVPADGDVVSVTMASSAACAAPATVSTSVTMSVTPVTTPTVVINATPGTTVCTGATAAFSTTITGGGATPGYLWSVNSVAIAGATASTYSYVPVSGDVVSVVMTSSSSCITSIMVSTSVTMTIDVPSVTAAVSAPGCGGTVTLSAGGALTYSWAPSTGLSCGGCASPTLTPVSSTTYTVTGTDASGCTGTATVTTDANRISGYISYSGGTSADTFKVWLIQFNPSDSSIAATDSTTSCLSAGMPYYEFMDAPAGNYMVKAQLNTSVPGTSGYIPTYSLSAPHWDSAATLTHATGADTMHINMVYGAVPSGPGFISGFVVSGAGRGTTGDVPAAGMLIYLKNAASGTLTYTYTATDGTYTFSDLANDTYTIYPESYKDYTTAETVTLSPSAEVANAVNFKQHTSYGTITPFDNTSVAQVAAATNNNIGVYPNPTTGNLNIRWGAEARGNATVSVADVVGREVYQGAFDVDAIRNSNPSTPLSLIDLAGVKEGVYIISIRAGNLNYSGKVVKQ